MTFHPSPHFDLDLQLLKQVLHKLASQLERDPGNHGAVQLALSRLERPMRTLLTARKFVQAWLHDVENELRGLLRTFGLKIGAVSRRKFEGRVRELVGERVGERVGLLRIMEPLLRLRGVALAELEELATHPRGGIAQRFDRVRRVVPLSGLGEPGLKAGGDGPLLAVTVDVETALGLAVREGRLGG